MDIRDFAFYDQGVRTRPLKEGHSGANILRSLDLSFSDSEEGRLEH